MCRMFFKTSKGEFTVQQNATSLCMCVGGGFPVVCVQHRISLVCYSCIVVVIMMCYNYCEPNVFVDLVTIHYIQSMYSVIWPVCYVLWHSVITQDYGHSHVVKSIVPIYY